MKSLNLTNCPRFLSLLTRKPEDIILRSTNYSPADSAYEVEKGKMAIQRCSKEDKVLAFFFLVPSRSKNMVMNAKKGKSGSLAFNIVCNETFRLSVTK